MLATGKGREKERSDKVKTARPGLLVVNGLGWMSANLCVEAHMRELLEDGFEVAIAKDATAGAQLPKGDAYEAALLNFRMIASSVQTTESFVNQLTG